MRLVLIGVVVYFLAGCSSLPRVSEPYRQPIHPCVPRPAIIVVTPTGQIIVQPPGLDCYASR